MAIVLTDLRKWDDAANALLFESLTGLDTVPHAMPATKAVVAWDQAVVPTDELRYGPGDIVPWLNNSTFFDKIVRWGMRRRDWRYLLVEYEDTVLLMWFKTDVEYMPQGQVPFDGEFTAACRLALWAIAADERV